VGQKGEVVDQFLLSHKMIATANIFAIRIFVNPIFVNRFIGVTKFHEVIRSKFKTRLLDYSITLLEARELVTRQSFRIKE
jgi:hypothetical protein